MATAEITEEDLNETLNHMHDLRVEVKRLHKAIGRMFESGLITDDMIGEALDDKVDIDDHYSLEVVFNSWGGNTNRNSDAVEQFISILEKIKSYQ